jgi:aldehyde:ferredoxin oxidoreductase
MINDTGRAPGRGGNGAVMGSKKLKAIVAHGTKKLDLADPDGYRKKAIEVNKLNATDPGIADLRELGTAEVMDNNWPVGDIPTKNWSLGSYEEMCVSLGGKKMRDTILVPHVACHLCSIGCSRWVKIEEGPYQMDGPGPEYETLGALGSMCMVDDLEAVSYAAHLCNIYGLDTISCGSTIAFAMECYEKGLITKEDTDGLELVWGDAAAMVEATRQIALGEGIGKLLGQGTRKVAEQVGGDAMDFAVQVKGLELPMHDPRAFFSWAVNYATSPRGGCHLHGMSAIYENTDDPIPEWDLTGHHPRHSDEHKGKISRHAQNWAHILNSMVICYFATFTLEPSDLAALVKKATGFDLTPDDLTVIGDRINALHRAYNYRCGIRREDDTLPLRSLTAVAEGGAAGKVPDLGSQLEDYYQVRRWEPDGKPSRDVLVELGLEDVAADLYDVGPA